MAQQMRYGWMGFNMMRHMAGTAAK